ncbi:hypothetical protein CBR_g41388 [Chara braunii]|uniref:Uncharacterized protein n=1 Tax=Chara braunii TaxID=69332 RepID=A0A388LW02_CHABU|nr:hypothetical protein CBR_g41388 [Chara braunii]|eukprot:GBG86392.1 hypothetical protein CBR_g41388 [Chara braunii]
MDANAVPILNDGFVQGRPILTPPHPPASGQQAPSNQVAGQFAPRFEQPPPPPLLQPPTTASNVSNAIIPYLPPPQIPFQQPRGTANANGQRGWNNRPRDSGGGGFSARLVGMFASVTGNGTRRRSNDISINEPASQELGFDRVNKGKKVAVAGPGKEGRKKYVEDLSEVLFAKTKHELEELCKKDKIKYVNKKITSAALARLRAIDAYGEDSKEEESEDEIQEENPS